MGESPDDDVVAAYQRFGRDESSGRLLEGIASGGPRRGFDQRQGADIIRLLLILVAVIGLAPTATLAAHGQIALTFDDLPALTILKSQAYVDYANDTILRGLKRHRIPAIGFVNEGKLDELNRPAQIANLRKWRDAGMQLGNHTFSHISPNSVRAAAYIADIARGDKVTRVLLNERRKPLRWFRHPYLETGLPKADKIEIDAWLTAHGYRIAPVTMEASDWMFAEPYDDAIARHDAARVTRIKSQYLNYTNKMVGWYQRASQSLLKRQIRFIMLLHVTRLNADSLDDLTKILARHDLRTVSLETAMQDAAYKIRDPYIGSEGIEWLERWSLEMHKELPWDDFTDPPANIEAEYRLVDSDH
jgi:peptidoglycan/xylan/chitin deacetylase (PgdA/CDA1 family)